MEEIQLIASISLKTKQGEEEKALPNEIWLEIFSKLPTKTIGKCRCLSKHWYNQLSTPHFIKKHLKIRQIKSLQLKQGNLCLVEKRGNLSVVVTCPANKRQELRKEIFPDLGLASYSKLGSCNGLFMFGKFKENLLLINPITLKQVRLPCSARTDHYWLNKKGMKFVTGFGYDYVRDEYKVVAVGSYVNTELETVVVVLVYSVKKGGSWRVVEDSGWRGDMYPPDKCGVFVKGALHWETGTGFPNDSQLIAVFDLTSESFHWIQSPSRLNRDKLYNKLLVLGGCLCTVDSDCRGFADLWIMKEYGVVESWTKTRIHGDGMWEMISLVCDAGNEKVLGVTNREKWTLCDLREGTCKKVAVGGKVESPYFSGHFVDSLVDPEQLVDFPEEVAG